MSDLLTLFSTYNFHCFRGTADSEGKTSLISSISTEVQLYVCIEILAISMYFHIKRHKLKQIRQNLKFCIYFTNNKYKQLSNNICLFFPEENLIFSTLHKTYMLT